MRCVDCHASQDHQIMGFSPDLRSRDLPDQRLTCDSCHTSAPHSDVLLNQRHARLDCRACHVPGAGGLVARDWTATPVFDPLTELYAPVDDVRAPNSVQPIYLWHNGQVALPDEPWPGSRSDLTARIQPFKPFTSTAPVDAASGQPIPLKLEHFYTQGDLEQAIAALIPPETGAALCAVLKRTSPRIYKDQLVAVRALLQDHQPVDAVLMTGLSQRHELTASMLKRYLQANQQARQRGRITPAPMTGPHRRVPLDLGAYARVGHPAGQ